MENKTTDDVNESESESLDEDLVYNIPKEEQNKETEENNIDSGLGDLEIGEDLTSVDLDELFN